MIKSNYQLDLKDTHHFSNKNGMIIDSNNNNVGKYYATPCGVNSNINTSNGQIIGSIVNPILVSANCPSSKMNNLQNNSCSTISNDIVNKIKKNLEQKAFMISKQQNVIQNELIFLQILYSRTSILQVFFK